MIYPFLVDTTSYLISFPFDIRGPCLRYLVACVASIFDMPFRFDIRGRSLRYVRSIFVGGAFDIRGPSLFVGLRYSWAFVIGGLVWLRYLICPPPCDIRGRCRFVGGACYIRGRVWLRHLICPSLRYSWLVPIRGWCRFVVGANSWSVPIRGRACYIRRRVWLRHLICPSLRHSRMPFPCLLYSLFNC